MQGGYEPRGSGGPGRGIYLVRRTVFILIAIVLFAFVLPRACGAFSGPDVNESDQRQKETERAQTPSGGSAGSSSDSSGGVSVNTIEVPSYPDDASSDDPAGTEDEDEPADDESGDASQAGPDDDDDLPSTVKETLAVEEPRDPQPSGIPTVALSNERARQGGGAGRGDPNQDQIEAIEITLFLRSNPPEPAGDPEPAQVASESIPIEQTGTNSIMPIEPGPTTNASVTSVSEPRARTAVRRAERVARSGNDVATASGNVADDGGDAAATLADARRSLDDIAAGGGARNAVRGAMRDAGAAVGAAESLDETPTGKNKRCKRNPQRCLGVADLLR